MKIAIISDIHENLNNLILAFQEFEKKEIEQVLFLGDFINAGVAKILANLSIPVFAIWGNNDGDKVMITKISLQKGSKLTVSDCTYDTIELDGRIIFMTHYPDLVGPIVASGKFDAVFYGHDHEKKIEKVGNSLVLNPGEISAQITGKASFAIYDSKENSAEIFDITGAISIKTELVDNYRRENNVPYVRTKRYQK